MDLLNAHGRAMDLFDGAVRRIGPAQWDEPTPCTEWTVRDLVTHLFVEQLWVPDLLAGRTIAEVGDRFDGATLGADPVGRWTEAASAARAAWLAPGALDRVVHLSYGDDDATEYGWQMTTDLAVHAWDLDTAIRPAKTHDTGTEPLDEDLAETLLRFVEPHVAGWQQSSLFAAPVPVSADAGPPRRLIGLLGRQVP